MGPRYVMARPLPPRSLDGPVCSIGGVGLMLLLHGIGGGGGRGSSGSSGSGVIGVAGRSGWMGSHGGRRVGDGGR